MRIPALFLFILIFSISLISTVPELPMIISGEVYINDNPAKIGTEITALSDGEEINKVQTTEKGRFEMLLQKLDEGQKVDFYVDGIYSNQSISYKSGNFQQLTLKVEKSYFFYYILGAIILLTGVFLTWKFKTKKPKQK